MTSLFPNGFDPLLIVVFALGMIANYARRRYIQKQNITFFGYFAGLASLHLTAIATAVGAVVALILQIGSSFGLSPDIFGHLTLLSGAIAFFCGLTGDLFNGQTPAK